MVLRGGENIYCSEVEVTLYKCQGIAECAVFGVEDERLGEEVGAAIYLEPGAELNADTVREFCTNKLAAFKIPRYLWIVDKPLPRNATGKFLKQTLKKTLHRETAN